MYGPSSRNMSSSYARSQASGRALACTSTQLCSALGYVHINEAWRTSSDVSSWRNVSSLAESLISRWSQPLLLSTHMSGWGHSGLTLNFPWQISKRDWLYTDINWRRNRFGCPCKQARPLPGAVHKPCVGRCSMWTDSASFSSCMEKWSVLKALH